MIVHTFDPIVLVGGADPGPEDLNTFPTPAPNLVGVDRGADHILAAGLTPIAVIGDLDSLSVAARQRYADITTQVAEQDTVDFEKALTRVQAPLIYAVGFSGGRLDHTLAVLDVMGRHADRPVILIGPDDVTAVVPRGGVTLSLSVGDRVSILPLATAQVTATGLRWPVDYTAMAPLGFASPSNAAAATQVRVDADAPVLLILPRGRLANLAGAISSSGR